VVVFEGLRKDIIVGPRAAARPNEDLGKNSIYFPRD
jgi:hypothetical protein